MEHKGVDSVVEINGLILVNRLQVENLRSH